MDEELIEEVECEVPEGWEISEAVEDKEPWQQAPDVSS